MKKISLKNLHHNNTIHLSYHSSHKREDGEFIKRYITRTSSNQRLNKSKNCVTAHVACLNDNLTNTADRALI